MIQVFIIWTGGWGSTNSQNHIFKLSILVLLAQVENRDERAFGRWSGRKVNSSVCTHDAWHPSKEFKWKCLKGIWMYEPGWENWCGRTATSEVVKEALSSDWIFHGSTQKMNTAYSEMPFQGTKAGKSCR